MKTIVLNYLVIIVIAISVIWSCSKSSTPTENDTVVTKISDIYYVAGDTSHKRTLDVYYKQNSTLSKVVFFVPGGAWRQGDKDQYDSMAMTLSSLYNYTVVITNYRLSNNNDRMAVHPNHVEDVALAFSWVMKNITNYGGDPESAFIFGQSTISGIMQRLLQ